MGVEKERWLGPGETARRLGVTTKALKVYEREGLVVPHRAQSGWRLYGPVQIARLHQIIVLRDLGLPLKSIGKLMASQSRLREILRLQLESLEAQQAKIARAIELIKTAQRQLDQGRDLSLDDLAILTKETVVQHPGSINEFTNRMEALIAEGDPAGQASQALKKMSDDLLSAASEETLAAELRALLSEAGRLKDIGDVNSEAAKQMVRRWRSVTASVKNYPTSAQAQAIRGAYGKALAEVEAKSETLPWPLPIDRAALEFLRQVRKGMRARGELN